MRVSGGRNFLLEHGQGSQPMETVVNLQTRQLTCETTPGLLDRHPVRGVLVSVTLRRCGAKFLESPWNFSVDAKEIWNISSTMAKV